DELVDLGEADDLVEVAGDFRPLHAADRAAEVNVLASGELAVKADGDLQERADTAVDFRGSARRIGDAGEDLEQRALSCAVAPDDADDLALLDLERDVLERPELGSLHGRVVVPANRPGQER